MAGERTTGELRSLDAKKKSEILCQLREISPHRQQHHSEIQAVPDEDNNCDQSC